jgi:hypothetical protein
MGHITADGPLLARLGGLVDPVEIRDEDGKILGVYTPALTPEEAALYARAAELFDWDEAERVAATQREGRTFEQVMEHLRSLDRKE